MTPQFVCEWIKNNIKTDDIIQEMFCKLYEYILYQNNNDSFQFILNVKLKFNINFILMNYDKNLSFEFIPIVFNDEIKDIRINDKKYYEKNLYLLLLTYSLFTSCEIKINKLDVFFVNNKINSGNVTLINNSNIRKYVATTIKNLDNGILLS